MTPLDTLSLCLCVLLICGMPKQGDTETLPTQIIKSKLEKETLLPCRYEQLSVNETVVQVTWFKVITGGPNDQIITAFQDKDKIEYETFGLWKDRVRFKDKQPTVDSTLVILSTKVSDHGEYVCRISSYPSGNHDIKMSLTVLTEPISVVHPVIVEEGDRNTKVAICRSSARPLPTLTWDTELNGRAVNISSDDGSISSQYFLDPLRSWNGKKLDCLVRHPFYSEPHRLKNQAVIHYPPNVEVSGYREDWHVGMENAALKCKSEGNPKPNITWIRSGAQLPTEVRLTPDGGLVFQRPLKSSDSGFYECLASNRISEAKKTVWVQITAEAEPRKTDFEQKLAVIVGAAAGGVLIIMAVIVIIVCRNYKRKSRLLNETAERLKEEQASVRAMSSISADGKDIYLTPIRMIDDRRSSFSSAEEKMHCSDSRSTISAYRGGGTLDSKGRPPLYMSRRGRDKYQEKDETSQLRVESFVKNNYKNSDYDLHEPLSPTTSHLMRSSEPFRQRNGDTIKPMNGFMRNGSINKSHQHTFMPRYSKPKRCDEDEVDEGLGGPICQEQPDEQNSADSYESEPIPSLPIPMNPHASITYQVNLP